MNAPDENLIHADLIAPVPTIPELRFRRFRGEADFPALLRVYNAAWLADHEERVGTLEWIKTEYHPVPNFDPYQDALLAEVNGEIVAVGQSRWFVERNNPRVILDTSGAIHPDWRRKGIGRALLHLNEAHLRETAERLQQKYPRPGWVYAFFSNANNFMPGSHALLKSEGYQPIRLGDIMVRPNLDDIPDLPLPAGLEVRPARPEDYRQIWDASQEAFRDHWAYTDPTEEDYQNWLTAPDFQPELWQVAWDGDQVAGMIMNFIMPLDNETFQRKRGWTEGICVRRPWRRMGLARALLARSMKMHRDLGMTETALGVDVENPNGAFKLYSSMGYQTIRIHTTYSKAL